MNETASKPDLRVLATAEGDTSLGNHYLIVRARIVYINDEGEVRNPLFQWRDDGLNEFADLALRGQLADYERTVTSLDIYGSELEFEQPYSVKLNRAESMVKVLRRLERRLAKANEQYGATDYAGLCGRLAVAIGAKNRYPLGIYEKGKIFPTTGSSYRWMDTDSLRSYLASKVQEWMTKHSITLREAS